ncbi:Glutathione-dependent formaldehyde-activating enzyme [Roseivivax sp. THAF40]|uniref:GFA family protein n=1 Tax=unclassified Roseivivax TaxID=2639302 RepID=UPI001267E900|nr:MULTISPECIES: GFA family protein [unclassified Roseivivax]QFS84401.1 Glutathione-dependent formaldehyde-activating enzyme [Roseivivax sp. THAF197b]QFT48229.1 Glutathione-dependent formaldehyde-activating enzyme [Roseivivax sp. THAF40]
MLTGSCCCGDITFTVSGTPKGAAVCHCTQCRKMSGHLWSSSYVPEGDIAIDGPVQWFAASDNAKRGFCPRCGSFLFWKAHDEDTMSFAMGAIDGPTDLSIVKHIFTDSRGDYYDLPDDVPCTP